jgi:riboflavin kinase
MIPAEDLPCLKAIALRGGCKGPVFVSTQSIGTMLAISQQTASRRIKGLEAQGLITRTLAADGQHVTLTKHGEDELRREYQEYSRIFSEGGKTYVLNGAVVSGIGEGKY